MDIREKIKAIKAFCADRDCYPDKCPLRNIETPFGCGADEYHPEEVEKQYELIFGSECTVMKNDNPYWYNICKLQDKQRKKGIETYGQGLEDNHEPVLVRIQHIEEELIDALMYLEWLKDKLGGMNNG